MDASAPWHAGRALRTPIVQRLVDMERDGSSVEDLRALRGRSRARVGCLEGDVDQGILPAGAAAGLVRDVPPVSEVVAELVRDYERLLAVLPRVLGPDRLAA